MFGVPLIRLTACPTKTVSEEEQSGLQAGGCPSGSPSQRGGEQWAVLFPPSSDLASISSNKQHPFRHLSDHSPSARTESRMTTRQGSTLRRSRESYEWSTRPLPARL